MLIDCSCSAKASCKACIDMRPLRTVCCNQAPPRITNFNATSADQRSSTNVHWWHILTASHVTPCATYWYKSSRIKDHAANASNDVGTKTPTPCSKDKEALAKSCCAYLLCLNNMQDQHTSLWCAACMFTTRCYTWPSTNTNSLASSTACLIVTPLLGTTKLSNSTRQHQVWTLVWARLYCYPANDGGFSFTPNADVLHHDTTFMKQYSRCIMLPYKSWTSGQRRIYHDNGLKDIRSANTRLWFSSSSTVIREDHAGQVMFTTVCRNTSQLSAAGMEVTYKR
jgi:hypothetical protein